MKNLVLLATIVLTACGRPGGPRHYQEIAIAPRLPQTGAANMAGPVAAGDVQLAWTTPHGWTEKSSSGPRLATFAVGDAECTIVSFPGDVGGLEANLKRWLGQLNADVSAEKLVEFARQPEEFSSDGGFAVMLFDFAAVLPSGAAASMLAAVLTVGDQTVFVKLVGPPASLQAEKPRFAALCRSVRPPSI